MTIIPIIGVLLTISTILKVPVYKRERGGGSTNEGFCYFLHTFFPRTLHASFKSVPQVTEIESGNFGLGTEKDFENKI